MVKNIKRGRLTAISLRSAFVGITLAALLSFWWAKRLDNFRAAYREKAHNKVVGMHMFGSSNTEMILPDHQLLNGGKADEFESRLVESVQAKNQSDPITRRTSGGRYVYVPVRATGLNCVKCHAGQSLGDFMGLLRFKQV